MRLLKLSIFLVSIYFIESILLTLILLPILDYYQDFNHEIYSPWMFVVCLYILLFKFLLETWLVVPVVIGTFLADKIIITKKSILKSRVQASSLVPFIILVILISENSSFKETIYSFFTYSSLYIITVFITYVLINKYVKTHKNVERDAGSR